MRLAFALALATSACDGGTNLDGSIACNSLSCGAGQLCVSTPAGIDAGTGPSIYDECKTVPDGCDVHDCNGDGCSACIQAMCYPTFATSVTGRRLGCVGQ